MSAADGEDNSVYTDDTMSELEGKIRTTYSGKDKGGKNSAMIKDPDEEGLFSNSRPGSTLDGPSESVNTGDHELAETLDVFSSGLGAGYSEEDPEDAADSASLEMSVEVSMSLMSVSDGELIKTGLSNSKDEFETLYAEKPPLSKPPEGQVRKFPFCCCCCPSWLRRAPGVLKFMILAGVVSLAMAVLLLVLASLGRKENNNNRGMTIDNGVVGSSSNPATTAQHLENNFTSGRAVPTNALLATNNSARPSITMGTPRPTITPPSLSSPPNTHGTATLPPTILRSTASNGSHNPTTDGSLISPSAHAPTDISDPGEGLGPSQSPTEDTNVLTPAPTQGSLSAHQPSGWSPFSEKPSHTPSKYPEHVPSAVPSGRPTTSTRLGVMESIRRTVSPSHEPGGKPTVLPQQRTLPPLIEHPVPQECSDTVKDATGAKFLVDLDDGVAGEERNCKWLAENRVYRPTLCLPEKSDAFFFCRKTCNNCARTTAAPSVVAGIPTTTTSACNQCAIVAPSQGATTAQGPGDKPTANGTMDRRRYRRM